MPCKIQQLGVCCLRPIKTTMASANQKNNGPGIDLEEELDLNQPILPESKAKQQTRAEKQSNNAGRSAQWGAGRPAQSKARAKGLYAFVLCHRLIHRRPPSDGPGCIKSHRGNGMEWNHQLGKLEFRAQSCVSFQRAKASGFGSSDSGHSHVQHAKAPGGSSGSSGSRHSHASISARQVGSLGRPHASGEPHISLSLSLSRERGAYLWEAILVWSPLKGIGLWQNGLVQIKFFFQINPGDIVFLIGRGHCCFDWPQATHAKLLDFARHLFDPHFFIVSQMELT